MPTKAEPSFYAHANAHIDLSNQQLQEVEFGKVSAAMMYATARFNASLTAMGYPTGAEMAANRNKNIDYFVAEYRLMLEEHLDDYIKNFDQYRQQARQ